MPRKCAVRTCSSRYYSQELSFHRFPNSEKLRKIWAELCQVTDRFDRSFRICSQHFASTDFERDINWINSNRISRLRFHRRRLICGAIPSLNLPSNVENLNSNENVNTNLVNDPINLMSKHQDRRNDDVHKAVNSSENIGTNTINTVVIIKKEPIFANDEDETSDESCLQDRNRSSNQLGESENEDEFIINIGKSISIPQQLRNDENASKRKEQNHLTFGNQRQINPSVSGASRNDRLVNPSVPGASRSVAEPRQNSREQNMDLRISNVRSLSENDRSSMPRLVEVPDHNQLMVIEPKKYYEIFNEFREILQSKDEKISFLEEKIRILEDRNFLLEKQLTSFSNRFHKKIPTFI